MKKIFFVVCLAVVLAAGVGTAAQAGEWTDLPAYKQYQEFKAQANEALKAGNLDAASELHMKCARLAAEHASNRIMGWRINSAAYLYIVEFKKNTDYDATMQLLYKTEPSADKMIMYDDIKANFKKHAVLLEKAKKILVGAEYTGHPAPKEKIKSNQNFCEDVLTFIEK